MAAAPLPHDWHALLDRFTEALADVQQSLAKATALEETSAAVLDAQALELQISEQGSHIAALHARTTSIDAWVDAFDTELRASEDVLRVLLSQTEAVRQKLATWAGRAIG